MLKFFRKTKAAAPPAAAEENRNPTAQEAPAAAVAQSAQAPTAAPAEALSGPTQAAAQAPEQTPDDAAPVVETQAAAPDSACAEDALDAGPGDSADAEPAADDAGFTLDDFFADEALVDDAAARDQRAAADAADAEQRGWRNRLGDSNLARGVGGLLDRNPPLDDELLDELETVLIMADVGIETTTAVCEQLRQRMRKREFADADALGDALRRMLIERLETVQQPLDISAAEPFVLLVVGVNGAGKTTTIGKLVRHAQAEGLSIMLAAGDTFRAAAVEQLQAWGERNQVPVVSQGQGADAASVVFDAVHSARARRADLLIADTAGRLHTQSNLMEELGKIARVIKKVDASAPHEVLMVIDGSTGQNAVSQVRQFRDMVNVTGLVVTKLDGTAKGGVVFALASEFGLPIRFVGLGEGIADLRVFEAERYVDGLLPQRAQASGAWAAGTFEAKK